MIPSLTYVAFFVIYLPNYDGVSFLSELEGDLELALFGPGF
jgi:hypothetical protein